jgi:hypothetical protein
MGKMAPTQPITKAAQDGQFDPGFVIRLNQFLKQSSLAMEPLDTEALPDHHARPSLL